MTYGGLKLRLTQMFPSGVSLDLIEGWIGDRYAEILGELPWSRLTVDTILETTAPYTAGTVAVTLGSFSITLTGGTWTAGMSGRSLRVAGRNESYKLSRLSNTTGLLDRAYEGPAAAAIGYSIFQNVYTLPANCRLLEDNALASSCGPMERTTRARLNQGDPSRVATGTPQFWASYMDDGSTPPLMQVELYPVPDQAIGIPLAYTADADPLTGSSTILKMWIQPAALVEGVVGKIKAHLKDYTGAQLAMATAAKALETMRGTEAQGMAPAQMQLDSYYTRHRANRWRR